VDSENYRSTPKKTNEGGRKASKLDRLPTLAFLPIREARHFWGERRGEVHPFIGLNAGTYYIRQRLDIGVWSIENDNWHVGLAPEFGLFIPVGRETYLTVMGRWN
jgi:hypothetical protein